MGDDAEQFRKIFIGGLHYQTTDESLREFYEKWGEVVDCVVMRDPYTRKSRGFGFITYSTAEMVDECLNARPHVIDGKQVDPKRAMPREDSNKPEAHLAVKKVFVGGVKESISDEDLQMYFSSYGTVQAVEMITDRETGRKRGFGFITFDDCDSVDKVVLRKNHIINGIQIEVKKAMEKDQMNSMSGRGGGSGGARGGFGGRGAGRGRGAAAAGGRGGRGGGYGSSNDGYGSGAGGYGADGYGGGYGGAGGYGGGSGGYGGGYNDGYGGGYGGASSGWGNQGGYGNGNGYGSGGGNAAGFGSGYGGSYGGGAMKSSGGYSQRGSGPYGGGGYGSGAGAGAGYGAGGAGNYGGGYGGY